MLLDTPGVVLSHLTFKKKKKKQLVEKCKSAHLFLPKKVAGSEIFGKENTDIQSIPNPGKANKDSLGACAFKNKIIGISGSSLTG